MVKLKISRQLAHELQTWAEDETRFWPTGTAYQDDLADMLRQIRGREEAPTEEYGRFSEAGLTP